MTKRAIVSTAVEMPGPVGLLEGAVDANTDSPRAVAVVCHPHPQQQGTMQNKVVTTLGRAFVHLGAAAVRFNYRGVGRSAGSYDGGVGERADALAVIDWSRARWPGLPVLLGGFSFGAAVALAIAVHAQAYGIVTVAPPISRLPADFRPPTCPWLLVHGRADDVVPVGPVATWVATLEWPPHAVWLDGVGHFFHGSLGLLTDAVRDFFEPRFAEMVPRQ